MQQSAVKLPEIQGIAIYRHLLHFKQPAGTSRGVYHTRKLWIVALSNEHYTAFGECAPLPDLSCDAMEDSQYEQKLIECCQELLTIAQGGDTTLALKDYQQSHRQSPSYPHEKVESESAELNEVIPETAAQAWAALTAGVTGGTGATNTTSTTNTSDATSAKSAPVNGGVGAAASPVGTIARGSFAPTCSGTTASGISYRCVSGTCTLDFGKNSGSCVLNSAELLAALDGEASVSTVDSAPAAVSTVKPLKAETVQPDLVSAVVQAPAAAPVATAKPAATMATGEPASAPAATPAPEPTKIKVSAGLRQILPTALENSLRSYPSIRFALESAVLQLKAQSMVFTDTPLTQGSGIPINGLVWMGDFQQMLERLKYKMSQGFKCIKLKIGAIDFEKELALLQHIREHFGPEQIEIRVDANGAFKVDEALDKLERLAQFNLHSIEQPIKAGQWTDLKHLCKVTPLPIALDEELIGINERERKIELLDTIQPQYIILKPSLHGGLSGSLEWIELARERKIPLWITSALESNLGLNVIAQFAGLLRPAMPQGLGTGQLFTDNLDFPLEVRQDDLYLDSAQLESNPPKVIEYLLQYQAECIANLQG